LLVGSVDGRIFYYSVASDTSVFNLVAYAANGLTEGVQSAPCYEDVNNDGKRDLIVGNASGGLSFFSSASQYVGIEEQNVNSSPGFSLFPNPAADVVRISIAEYVPGSGSIKIVDVLGHEVMNLGLSENYRQLHIGHLSRGIYFIVLSLENRLPSVKKLIRN
jgi:hypothetical protein